MSATHILLLLFINYDYLLLLTGIEKKEEKKKKTDSTIVYTINGSIAKKWHRGTDVTACPGGVRRLTVPYPILPAEMSARGKRSLNVAPEIWKELHT